MNVADGTSYTVGCGWGPCATQISNETVSLSGGFYTFANANVTPNSVQFSLTPSGGSAVVVSGDCPQWQSFNAGTNCGGAANTGGVGIVGGFFTNAFVPLNLSIVDSNGSYEVVTTAGETGGSVPAWPAATNATCNGTQTTVSGTATFTCYGPSIKTGSLTYSTGVLGSVTFGGSGSLPAGETLTVSYTTNGWMTTHANGTSPVDEDGSSPWIGTNLVCPFTLPVWSAGMAITAQETEIQDPTSGSWQLAIQTGIAGGSLPPFSSTETTVTTDGTGKWVSLGKPVCGVGGDWPAPTMTAAYGADVEAFMLQLGEQYVGTAHTIIETIWPDAIDSGPNFTGGFNDAADVNILIAEQMNSDAMLYGGNPSQVDPNTMGTSGSDDLSLIKYQWMTHYFHKPIWNQKFDTQIGQTMMFASSCVSACFSTWADEGHAWYLTLKYLLNSAVSADGTFQFAAQSWWLNQPSQNTDFTWLDTLANPIDGVDNVNASVPCSWDNTVICGGEGAAASWVAGANPPWVGANMFTCSQCIADGNQLWLATSVAPSLRFKVRKKGIIFGGALLQ